jgi:hypothetical protein
MKKADQWSGIFLLIISASIVWGSLSSPYGSINKPGPGFFPFWIGVLLGGMSLGLLIKSTISVKGGNFLREIFGGKIRWGKVIFVLACLLFYALSLDYLGYLFVTFLLMLILLRFVDPQPWRIVLLWALVGSIVSYLIFGRRGHEKGEGVRRGQVCSCRRGQVCS